MARYGLTPARHKLERGLPGRGHPRPRTPRRVSIPPAFPETSKHFKEGSVCKLFVLFQVVRGAHLGPQVQGTWQIGVECRGKKFCPRIKLIILLTSPPFFACLINSLGGMF